MFVLMTSSPLRAMLQISVLVQSINHPVWILHRTSQSFSSAKVKEAWTNITPPERKQSFWVLREYQDSYFVYPWDNGGEHMQVTVGLDLSRDQDRSLEAFHLLLGFSWVKDFLLITLPPPIVSPWVRV